MKKNFATYATGIAMHNRKQHYTTLIFLCLASGILFGCSAPKNSTLAFNTANTTTKNKSLFFENTNKNARLYGTITDRTGVALKDVEVICNNQQVALTDDNGAFSFSIEKEIGKMYKLIFSKDGYNKAARNYNAEMDDASYNIMMVQPCKCDTTICNTCFTKNVGFDFEKDSDTLSKEQKIILDALIECLKLHPEKEIIVHHYTMFPKRAIASQRLDAVVKYFTQKGVMDYRIKKEMVSEKNTAARQIEIVNK
jgi:outer membrane protein OmpA-like peptidoglycan-associated protein